MELFTQTCYFALRLLIEQITDLFLMKPNKTNALRPCFIPPLTLPYSLHTCLHTYTHAGVRGSPGSQTLEPPGETITQDWAAERIRRPAPGNS